MRIDVALSPLELATFDDLAERSVVVIDVLRATTTIATALAAGASAVLSAANPEEARAIARSIAAERPVLAGEVDSRRIEGFDLGNSPVEVAAFGIAGRPLVLSTTNGTRVLAQVRHAARVVTAGFVNVAAVVAELLEAPTDTLIVCSGHVGHVCMEDAACAGLIVERLQRRVDWPIEVGDGALLALSLQDSFPGTLELLWRSEHGRDLVRLGFEKDLPACAALDSRPVVPRLRGDRLVRSDDNAS